MGFKADIDYFGRYSGKRPEHAEQYWNTNLIRLARSMHNPYLLRSLFSIDGSLGTNNNPIMLSRALTEIGELIAGETKERREVILLAKEFKRISHSVHNFKIAQAVDTIHSLGQMTKYSPEDLKQLAKFLLEKLHELGQDKNRQKAINAANTEIWKFLRREDLPFRELRYAFNALHSAIHKPQNQKHFLLVAIKNIVLADEALSIPELKPL